MSRGMESNIHQAAESSFKGITDGIQAFLKNQGGGGSSGGGGGDSGGGKAPSGGGQGELFDPIAATQSIAKGLEQNIYG